MSRHEALRACPTKSKQRFSCSEAAAAFLRRERERGRGKDDQVYRCVCRQWHVGRLTASLRHKIHRALARTA